MHSRWLLALLVLLASIAIARTSQLDYPCQYFVLPTTCQYSGFPPSVPTFPDIDSTLYKAQFNKSQCVKQTINLAPCSTYILNNPRNIDLFGLELKTWNPTPEVPLPLLPILATSINLFRLAGDLTLKDLVVESVTRRTCLDTGSPYYQPYVKLENVELRCPLGLGGNGQYFIHNSNVTSETPSPFNFIDGAYLEITNSTFSMGSGNLTITLYQGSEAKFSESRFLRPVFTEHYGAVFLAQQNLFSSSVYIDINSNKQNIQDEVVIQGNHFGTILKVEGVSWNATVVNNVFSGRAEGFSTTTIEGVKKEMIPHWAATAIFSGVCNAHLSLVSNDFSKCGGTLYIDMPQRISLKKFCPQLASSTTGLWDPYSSNAPNLAKNRFRASRSSSKNNKPSLPSVVLSTVYSPFEANWHAYAFKLNMQRNWWGDSSGPWLCCNPSPSLGLGGFSSPFIDSSAWCLDEQCENTSAVYFSDNCIRHGCPQIISARRTALIAISAIIALGPALFAIIWALYQDKARFTADLLQYAELEHLLKQASRIMIVGLFTSSFGSIALMTSMGAIINANSKTVLSVRQEAIFNDTKSSILWFAIFGGLQLVLNLLMFAALIFRHKAPKLLIFSLKPSWLVNVSTLIYSAVVVTTWFPTLYHSGNSITSDPEEIKGRQIWILSSPHNKFILIGVFSNIFVALSSMIPAKIVHSLVHHFEYSKMSTTVEESLIKDLIAIPLVKKLSIWLRIASGIGLALGLAWFSLQLVSLISPNTFYDSQFQYMIPSGTLRIASGTQVLFQATGICALFLAIWSTLRLRRAQIYTIINLLLTISLIGTIVTLATWFDSFVPGSYRPLHWGILHYVIGGLWIVLTIINMGLLQAIRRSIIRELPKQAATGINSFVDDMWHRNPTSSHAEPLSETTALLSSEYSDVSSASEDESHASQNH